MKTDKISSLVSPQQGSISITHMVFAQNKRRLAAPAEKNLVASWERC